MELYKCDGKIVKDKDQKPKQGNHYCTCQKPVIFYDAYSNYNIRKLRCNECYKRNNSNKRQHSPDTDEGNKKPKFNIPEAEDPMEEMELNPQKLNKGKKKI